jgi:hypothetical protein
MIGKFARVECAVNRRHIHEQVFDISGADKIHRFGRKKRRQIFHIPARFFTFVIRQSSDD